ncbi:MAG: imidazole glycerol phosphate synthase subunit HisF, partial [Leptospiraceae bacterium]|nr:imidazole glycerol phosphate synthase subunit HisF [Leptospiraceae bacterium]
PKKNIRIIPRLDIKGPNVVKGIHMEGLRVVGRPELFANQYYLQGADEIIYIDTVASLYQRNNLEDIISRAADQIFLPLTVGGGIRSKENAKKILRAGADKVAINTALFENPELISECANAFGSSCVVVSIQAKKNPDGRYECMKDNARERTGFDVIEWVEKVEKLGAGEIMITSIDRDGTGKGYDNELLKEVSNSTSIPVIASGGAGNYNHVIEVLNESEVDAVAIASVLHFNMLEFMKANAEYTDEGNTDFLQKILKGEPVRKGIEPISILELKKKLSEEKFECRIID